MSCKDTDFISARYLSELRNFAPQARSEYLDHLQRVYNYKLHTDFPLVLHIEPTNKCNQVCRMCCHPTMKREGRHVEDSVVRKAIKEASEFMPWSTHFFFFGEPFLNKKVFDYFEWAKNSSLRNISTTTNLTAITKAEIERLPTSGLDSIHISFEGLNRDHYKLVRGKDTFEAAKRNILALIDAKSRANSDLWIAMTFVQTTETDEEIQTFLDEWSPLVNNLHVSPQFEYRNGSVDGSKRQSISVDQVDRNDGNIMFTSESHRVPCRQLWTRLVVTSDGEMTPCSQNIDAELSLGNINDISIHEAWTGRLMQELRMQHLANDYFSAPGLVCKKCTDWDWSGKVDVRPNVG